MPDKLSKKQLKALEFKAKTSEKAAKQLEEVKRNLEIEKKEKDAKDAEKKAAEEAAEQTAKPKKRKTRRGHKGKGKPNGNHQPRFILFVGNLPYSADDKQLREHFKAGKPDVVRIRKDKGIAFLEFLVANGNIQGRIDACLLRHHSMLGNRKINVELTAGGGGNSEQRLEKIKTKNEKLLKERSDKIRKDRKKLEEKQEKEAAKKAGGDAETGEAEMVNGVHPSRLGLIEH